jgi:hypothetical protein
MSSVRLWFGDQLAGNFNFTGERRLPWGKRYNFVRGYRLAIDSDVDSDDAGSTDHGE